MTKNSHALNSGDRSENHTVLILVAEAVLGTILLCVGFANIYNLVEWSQDYNQVLVYFGFFLWMSIAGMLFWSGITGIITRVKESLQ